MKIKVLKTIVASKDESGCYSKKYEAGLTYDIYDKLANTFIQQKWGILAEPKQEQEEVQDIIIEAPEVEVENKAIQEEDIEAPQIKTKKKKSKQVE
jgi:hypothetical protein